MHLFTSVLSGHVPIAFSSGVLFSILVFQSELTSFSTRSGIFDEFYSSWPNRWSSDLRKPGERNLERARNGVPYGWRVARRLPEMPPLHCVLFDSAVLLTAMPDSPDSLARQTGGIHRPRTSSWVPNAATRTSNAAQTSIHPQPP